MSPISAKKETNQKLAINLFSRNYLGSKKRIAKSDENWQMGLLITKHLAGNKMSGKGIFCRLEKCCSLNK
jgi:hypothetical protein